MYLFIIMAAMVCLSGCGPYPNPMDREAMADTISTRTKDLQAALLSNDLNKRMTFYDEGASLSPDGFAAIHGRNRIRELLKRGMGMAKFTSLKIQTDTVAGDQNYIRQMGIMHSQIIVNDSARYDNSAKFFYLWKRQPDGTYAIVTEMYNTINQDED